MSANEVILHCQRQLKKELSDEKILHYLRRLARIKITIGLLEQTGIGRSVNQLSRNDGIIGHESRKLVRKWKKIVEEQKQLEEENSNSPSSTPDNRSECDDDDDDDNELVIDQNHIDFDRDRDNDNEIVIKAEAQESDNEDYEDKVNRCWNNESEDENENEFVNNSNQYVPSINVQHSSNSDDQDSSGEGEKFIKYTKKQQTDNLPSIKIEHESNSDDSNSNNDFEEVIKMNKHNEKKSRKSKDKDNSNDRDKHYKNMDMNLKIKVEKLDSDDHAENEKRRKSHKSHSREHEKEKVDHNHNHHKHKKEKSRSRDKDYRDQNDKIKNSDGKKRKNNHESSLEISSKKVKSHTDLENEIDINMKSKIIKKEIDSTSGFNFSDVMGSLSEANGSKSKNIGSTSSKKSSSKTSKNSVIMSSSSQIVNCSNKNENKKKALSKSPAKLKPSIENLIRSSSPKYIPNLSMSFSQETDKNKNNHHDMSLDLNVDDHFISEYKPVSNYKPVIAHKVNYDALSSMITSRKERTKVFSGHKSNYFTGEIPRLFDMCLQTINENIDQLGYTGGVPYDILEPVFSKITAQQLLNVEEYNPYIIESSDELWEFHCKRDFRGKNPEEFETWREFYLRSIDERESKLASLTSKVKKTLAHATPIRKAKLAYFENTTTSNYNKNKAATIKNGMKTLKHRENKESQARSRLEKETTSSQMPSTSKKSSSESNKNGMVDEVSSVIIRTDSKASSAPAPPKERESKAINLKPKKAPLMQKTLRIMKSLYRR